MSIDFFDVGSYKAESSKASFESSELLIAEYMSLLEQQYCLRVGLSCGKDSTVVWNAAIEAMRRAIESGLIDPEHPIVAVTVDTKLEQESIQCYVPFAHKAIRELCDKHDINLFMEIVKPPLHQELMILFANAQKLFATAASGRSADCSVIWKIDSSIKALRQIKQRLPFKYQNAVWISISGSRSEESARRSNNMLKQGVRSLKAHSLIEQIKADGEPGGSTYKFAPISDWSTKDVIAYLTHAGEKPMAKTQIGHAINCYGENFGLLLAIYGEGSSDVCEMVALDDKKVEQKGCGKVARFGCVTCGLVGENHSAIEMESYARWSRFGDGTRRFRDYLTRVSDDLNCRAFHARAYDPSGNNNVFLQPNVLKAKVLEKMVWYASQISVDSIKIHEEFVRLHATGSVESDVGIKDIMSDSSLTGSVRKQYIEMYTSRMLAGPMFEMFSVKHATLLSLLWSLHGVAALPYRPLAIFNEVSNGKRIPFPLTNKELDAKRAKIGLVSFREELRTQSIKDALVVQLFTPAKVSFSELKKQYGEDLGAKELQPFMPFSLESAWSIQDIGFNINASLSQMPITKAAHTRKFKLEYTLNTNTGKESVKAKCMVSGKMINLNGNKELNDALIELGRKDYDSELAMTSELKGLSIEKIIEIRSEAKADFSVVCTHEFSNQKMFTSDSVYFSPETRSKAKSTRSYSERKRIFNKDKGTYSAGRASLKMYKASPDSGIYAQHAATVSYWVPDSTQTREVSVGVTEYQQYTPSDDAVMSFSFDDELFNAWVNDGGHLRLIAEHNDILAVRIKNRMPLRSFFGTSPVYKITNVSGLSISARFEDKFRYTLKRTEVFHNAGLFSIASESYEKIMSMPGVISMTEHRAQKTQILLAIRHLRNKQRKEICTRLMNNDSKHALRNVINRLNEFAGHYENVAKSYIVSSALQPFGNNAELRAIKLKVWLNEFSDVLSSVDGAMSLLSTDKEREMIGLSFDATSELSDNFEKITSLLKNEIINFSNKQVFFMRKARFDVLSDKNHVNISDNRYVLCDSLDEIMSGVSAWIKSHYKETNVFLLKHGFTIALARMSGLDYIDVMTVSASANTEEKKASRKQSALNDWDMSIHNMSVNNHDCFNVLMSMKSGRSKSKAISKLSSAVKTNKLLALMAS